jgi:outer membrane protein assembly factor BamE (lipoprotein component of BamABCDE complex)
VNKCTLLLAVVAVLAGCATQEGVRPYWTLRESNFSGIKPQTTTKADVEQMVGRPMLTTVFPNLSEEVWDYRYIDGVKTWVAEVHFDLQGKTKYLATYPDRCPMSATPCRP